MSNQPLPSPLALALGARTRLAGECEHLNAINVYPVADGDTGSNLLATVDAIVAEVKIKDYSAQALIESIVLSTPFRQKERPKEKKIL